MLVTAIVIAFLYFALMTLVLMDSMREAREATRFKNRIIAMTLAENGAELAAVKMITATSASRGVNDDQGVAYGQLVHGGEDFQITGTGRTTGAIKMQASVRLKGKVSADSGTITIEWSTHSQ